MAKRGRNSIFDFIDTLKAEQNLVSAKIANCTAGVANTDKPKKDVVQREENIRRIIADFLKQLDDTEVDLLTSDEDESDDENDANASNSQLSQNWLNAKRHAITQHPTLILINAIAHHTRL